MLHNHHYWWHLIPHKELSQVYASIALRFLATSSLILFVPLYLYQEVGYTFTQTLSFYIFYSLVFAIATPVAAKFASRFGVKHTVFWSIPLYILFIISLYFLRFIHLPLILLSIMVGVSLAFYWMGINLVFHHASDHKHRGAEIGKRTFYKILATTLGPLLGGALITFIGFYAAFVFASLILILSSVILFFSKEIHVNYQFSLPTLIKKDHWKDSLFFVSRGTEVMAEEVLWPLFIFFILGSYLSLGLSGAILSLLSGILAYLVGKFSDYSNKRTIIALISVFDSLSWFIKSLIQTVAQVFGVTIFGAVTLGIRESPLGALEYDKAQNDIAGYFVSREIFLCLGRILILMVVLMAENVQSGFVFQGFASLAAILF